MEEFRAMQDYQIGYQGLERLYKAVAERALDRIRGVRFCEPSPFHDRIDLATARMHALSPDGCTVPSRSLAMEALQAAGLDERSIMDVLETIDCYKGEWLVHDGQVAAHLKRLKVPATDLNIARSRPTATAAMVEACLSALSTDFAPTTELLPVVPAAMREFGSIPIGKRTSADSRGAVDDRVQAPMAPVEDEARGQTFSEVAEIIITTKVRERLWSPDRAREVRASVNLFVGANGDIPFARIEQLHLFACVDLMSRLPKKYNHFMVQGQGGFAAALASVEPHPLESEADKAVRLGNIGVHSATRNKHLTWLKAVVDGAAAAGFTKHSLDFKSLRHNAKQAKMTDKRKKNEKRPNWTIETFAKLTSGPVYEGCAGIDNRFIPGPHVIHDGVYWSPLVNLNICGRPSEGAGLEVADVFPDAPIPYIHVRPNSLRGLKVDEGERTVAIHPKLIELGFLDYVRLMNSAGHVALFPEFVHPTKKLNFDWMMRRRAIDPARALHFPHGTGLEFHGKSPDGHSLRGTGRTALRNARVELPMRNYISGHIDGTVGVEVYEADPELAMVKEAIVAFDPFFEHLQRRPLNIRPRDRMTFGSPRGRRVKVR
ncbi:MAG: hypothetical protein DI636_02970 [Pelagerythrobacter marensis]|nr:MAG: hypothetical protein DI636_02970 [Pelagerythrobacter marensis]